MKRPSILEIRFGKAVKKQKKLSHSELQSEVASTDKIGADKFRRDCFSVFLKNNSANKKNYNLSKFLIQGGLINGR